MRNGCSISLLNPIHVMPSSPNMTSTTRQRESVNMFMQFTKLDSSGNLLPKIPTSTPNQESSSSTALMTSITSTTAKTSVVRTHVANNLCLLTVLVTLATLTLLDVFGIHLPRELASTMISYDKFPVWALDSLITSLTLLGILLMSRLLKKPTSVGWVWGILGLLIVLLSSVYVMARLMLFA